MTFAPDPSAARALAAQHTAELRAQMRRSRAPRSDPDATTDPPPAGRSTHPRHRPLVPGLSGHGRGW